jgi:hypothetical protein
MPRLRHGFLPLVIAILWSNYAMSAVPQTRSQGFHLDAPLARVIPLFTAEGERRWAEGWDPEVLSGAGERGSVFRTSHGGRVTTWIVTDYRPAEGRASYARLAEGSNMGLVDVICTASPKGGTDVSVRYTLTAVSAEGERFIDEFLSPEHYQAMIEEWHAATAAAIQKGE